MKKNPVGLKTIIVVLALIVVGFLIYDSRAGSSAKEADRVQAAAPVEERSVPVKVTPARSRRFEDRLVLQGNLEAGQSAKVPALVSGAIMEIFVKEGELTDSLKRVMLVTEEETRAVKFMAKKGLLIISSKKIGTGDVREEIEVDYEGEEIEFGLNSRYVLDVLSALEGEKISLEVEDSSTPVLIKEFDNKDVIAVVMPMML